MTDTAKTITSACGEYCAEIAPRESGGFQVTVFRWREEWVPGCGTVGEGWACVSHPAMLADTLELAAALAAEEFRSHGTAAAVG